MKKDELTLQENDIYKMVGTLVYLHKGIDEKFIIEKLQQKEEIVANYIIIQKNQSLYQN